MENYHDDNGLNRFNIYALIVLVNVDNCTTPCSIFIVFVFKNVQTHVRVRADVGMHTWGTLSFVISKCFRLCLWYINWIGTSRSMAQNVYIKGVYVQCSYINVCWVSGSSCRRVWVCVSVDIFSCWTMGLQQHKPNKLNCILWILMCRCAWLLFLFCLGFIRFLFTF